MREPLLSRTSVASAVTLLVGLAALVGVNVSQDDQTTIVNAALAVVSAVAVIGHYYAAWRARQKVTPVADPKDADGVPLVPLEPEISPRQSVLPGSPEEAADIAAGQALLRLDAGD